MTPDQIQEWTGPVRDLVMIVGGVGAFLLYLRHIAVLRAKISLLEASQYPEARARMEAMKADAEERQHTLEDRIRRLATSGEEKNVELADLRYRLEATTRQLEELGALRDRPSQDADAESVQNYVLSLGWLRLNDYFETVLRAAHDQAQKHHGREPSAEDDEGSILKKTAAQYGRDWAKRKGVLAEWNFWYHLITSNARSKVSTSR